MDEVEQNTFHYGEILKNYWDLGGGAEQLANLKEVLRRFSGSTPSIPQAPGLTLDVVGVGMLQECF